MGLKIPKRKCHLLVDSDAQRGMSLVELLVAIVISMVVSLAVYGVLATSEGKKRTTTSLSDIQQSGVYVTYLLERSIRSAGAGFSAIAPSSFGCLLNAANSGTKIFPAPSYSLPPPFDGLLAAIGGSFRMAPVIIVNGIGAHHSDALIVMAGDSGLSGIGTSMSNLPSSTELTMKNVASFKGGDIVAIVDPAGASSGSCLISQVNATFVPIAGASSLPLAGKYYTASGESKQLAEYSIAANVISLGAHPVMDIITVGSSNTLFRYDAFQGGAAVEPIAEGVHMLYAYYGVDVDGDPVTTDIEWINPAEDAAYSAPSLLDGSLSANTKISNIRAIRVGVVMKSSLPEKEIVSPENISLFADTGKPLEIELTERNYRYRVFEITIPLRNLLLATA